MYEKVIERAVCAAVERRGGKAYKWVCPGQKGVPDRICIFPGGKVIFVELKRPGLEDGRSPLQKKMFAVLTALGCTVWRIDSAQVFNTMLTGEGL